MGRIPAIPAPGETTLPGVTPVGVLWPLGFVLSVSLSADAVLVAALPVVRPTLRRALRVRL